MPAPFKNRRLFSDHYLEEVLPTLELWRVDLEELAGIQAELRTEYQAVQQLVTGHEGQTEEHWIRPILRKLGFYFQVFPAVSTAEGFRWPDYALFATEHARDLSEGSARTPVYFDQALAVADAKVWDRPLDHSISSQDPYDRRNPSAQIDAYMRETGRRWAILTNGRKWRLYSRDTSYRLDTYYEVDVIELLDGTVESFKYFWLLFQRAAFENQPDSRLDGLLRGSVQYAEGLPRRIKERIYDAVHEFVNGFFANSSNALDPTRDVEAAFQASLILLYRLLFVLYAESRALLPLKNPGYRGTYSLTAIKENLASRLDVSMALLPTTTNYYDALGNLFRLVERGSDTLSVPKYNGGLFDDARHLFLRDNKVGDVHLARGIDLLARVPGRDGGLVFVDFRSLDVRHLGDIYEGLLEYHARHAAVDMVAVADGDVGVWKPAADVAAGAPVRATAAAGTIYLATGKGERRATGSYYTPHDVVAYMVAESIGRLVAELATTKSGAKLVEAVMALRICDPAMGSGHFLVESVEYLARTLVEVGAPTDSEPNETELQTWRRRVVERCVYGVDQNPLAVELAKLSLWLATVSLGRPLSFLDNHLLHGNSLNGTELALLGSLRARSTGQQDIFNERLERILPSVRSELVRIAADVSETIEDVHAKEALLDEARKLLKPFKSAADAWTAAHFGVGVNSDQYGRILEELDHPRRLARLMATELSEVATAQRRFGFFHWELEFPEVFSEEEIGGFDVVLTNPPYVNAIELNAALSQYEKPYWRTRFASAAGAYDLYVLFIEMCLSICRPSGFVSLITPNKYLAAPYAKELRTLLGSRHRLHQILDASHLRVFDDPMIYPIVSLLSAKVLQGV